MLGLTPDNKRDLRVLLRFLAGSRSRILAAAGTMLTSVVVQLPVPFLMMVLTDRLVSHRDVSMLPLVTGGIMLCAVFAALVGLAHTFILVTLREQVLGGLELKLVERLQRAPLDYHQEHAPAYLASRIHSDVRSLNALLVGAALSTAQNLLLLVGGVVSVFVLSWRLALIATGLIPLLVLGVSGANRRMRALSQLVQETGARFASRLQETMAHAQMVKAFGIEAGVRGALRRHLLTLIGHVVKQEMVGATAHRLAALGGMLMPLLLIRFGASELMEGRLSVGQFVALNAFFGYILAPALMLLQQNLHLQVALVSLRRVVEILELPAESTLEPPCPLPAGRGLRFESVSFSYRPGVPVLRDFDLSVAEGETVAIVGPSGEGKTTLLRLLLRLHEPTAGRLLMDGVDIRHLDLDGYRSRFTIVFQDPFLMDGTVADNLRVGRPAATSREIDAALRMACAEDFVAALPNGRDTPIAAAGVKLSAGQKMRLAIARAVLRDAEIVLLDEPTASLDLQTEKALLENLRGYLKSRTTLLVSHRPAALALASRVVVVRGGQAVEERFGSRAYRAPAVERAETGARLARAGP